MREQHHLPHRALPAEQHRQPVDPHAEPARRRHPILHCRQELLVQPVEVLLRVLQPQRFLLLEPPPLLDRVVQLRERVAHLHARHEPLEPLHVPVPAQLPLRQRRHLDRVVHEERRLHQVRLHLVAQQLVDQPSPAVLLRHHHAQLPHPRRQRRRVPVLVDVDARVLEDGRAQVQSPPRRPHVDRRAAVLDLRRAQQFRREPRHHRLHQRHDVVVVRVRLVALHRRELRVVRGVEALVAEDPPDLVHPVQPADDAPLQVQLRRDAQVQRAAQRVVLRHEGPRVGARRDGQQDGRLHLQVVATVHEPPDRRHQPAPQHEPLPHLVVRDQVRLPLPQPLLHVLQPVPLLRRRPQRLPQHRRRPRLNRGLARPRVDQPSPNAQEVPQVQRPQQLEVRPHDVAPELRLHRPRPVAQV